MITKLTFLILTVMGLSFLAGCEDASLAHRQDIDRARLPLQPVAANPDTAEGQPTMPAREGLEIAPPLPQVTGTYTFTAPPTVTTVEHRTNDFHQFQLYAGRPSPSDTPFLTLWVGPHPTIAAKAPNTNLKPDNQRAYIFNSLLATQWSGYTADKHYPFVELILKRPGAAEDADQLHAIAIAKDSATRKTALEILSTIQWTPNE